MKPIKAHARNTDPETSREAAEAVVEVGEKQHYVMRAFVSRGRPMDDQSLQEQYRQLYPRVPPQSESGIRSRRAELVRKGLIVDSGRRVKTASGRNAIVWRLA